MQRGIGTKCVMPMCGHEDTLEHMKMCKFYETKWDDIWVEDEEVANYLEKANRERFIKTKMPLMFNLKEFMYMYTSYMTCDHI